MYNGFRFGLEAEFMLAHKKTFAPLWYKDVQFNQLDEIFSAIDLSGLPPMDGLSTEPPHKKIMPFIVEGYGITDENFNVTDAYPKGVEIRTPVCYSLDELFKVYEDCFGRMKKALNGADLTPIAMSHHPIETKFSGPQNKRRHDFWLWAMEVMTTYGPDINVSFPNDITQSLFSDLEDLNQKVNYYAPALAAISLASPFYKGEIWNIKGEEGLSYRTFKRSIIAPAIELHPDENFRIEFKVFEMSNRVVDFKNYFLLVLALFLDEDLKGRASSQERIYDSGAVSRSGIHAPGMKQRFMEIYQRAPKVLEKFGFPAPQIDIDYTPAQQMKNIFRETGKLSDVIEQLSWLHTLDGHKI